LDLRVRIVRKTEIGLPKPRIRKEMKQLIRSHKKETTTSNDSHGIKANIGE
jgi:hypothetical protein